MGTVVCEKHNLRYDPGAGAGCVLCLRDLRREPSSSATPARWPTFVVVVALLGGVSVLVYFLAFKKKPSASTEGASAPPRADQVLPEVGELSPPEGMLDAAGYLPLAPGNTWTYDVRTKLGDGAPDRETREWIVKDWKGPDGEPAFMLDDTNRGMLNAHDMIYAVRGGDLVSFAGFFGGAKTQFDDSPFVDLPARLARGAAWRYTGHSSGRPFELASSLAGIERVTVAAGTFECVRIDRVVPGAPGVRTSVDYAKGVGVVRVDGTRPANAMSPGAEFVWSLVKYHVGR